VLGAVAGGGLAGWAVGKRAQHLVQGADGAGVGGEQGLGSPSGQEVFGGQAAPGIELFEGVGGVAEGELALRAGGRVAVQAGAFGEDEHAVRGSGVAQAGRRMGGLHEVGLVAGQAGQAPDDIGGAFGEVDLDGAAGLEIGAVGGAMGIHGGLVLVADGERVGAEQAMGDGVAAAGGFPGGGAGAGGVLRVGAVARGDGVRGLGVAGAVHAFYSSRSRKQRGARQRGFQQRPDAGTRTRVSASAAAGWKRRGRPKTASARLSGGTWKA